MDINYNCLKVKTCDYLKDCGVCPGQCSRFVKNSNHEWLRAMSVEELTDFIYMISTNMCCDTVCPKKQFPHDVCKPSNQFDCRKRIKSWLNRPVEEFEASENMYELRPPMQERSGLVSGSHHTH